MFFRPVSIKWLQLKTTGVRSLFAMGGNQSHTDVCDQQQAKFIQQSIDKKCVVIFSTTTCPYCYQAKSFFEKLGVPYESIELNKREDGRLMAKCLAQMTNSRTVPQVFINGQCIGGASDTKKLFELEQLQGLVEQCSKPS